MSSPQLRRDPRIVALPAADLPRLDVSELHVCVGDGVAVLIGEAGENSEPVAWYSDASVTE